jgi:hypothetical protein
MEVWARMNMRDYTPRGAVLLLILSGVTMIQPAGGSFSNFLSAATSGHNPPREWESQHQQTPAGGLPSTTGAKAGSSYQPQFGGRYDQLTPAQRKLVDEWFARYKERTGKNLNPASAYGLVSVSIRTTFEAITNALANTPLTDKSGNRLGTALDLVQSVDKVNGQIPRAPGDAQFRMYVVMRPDVLQLLGKCREFSRKGDNSVFHHGYPLNYRQGGGDPSIQISMSRGAARADIDVDYRSSRFPAGLFNGHLTAANSDIRAGNNYRGHLRRWNGLANWWRDLFGLPVESDGGFVPEPEHNIPSRPRLNAKASLDEVVNDYLSSWLVQRKPNLAVAYISPRAFACVNSGSGSGHRSADSEEVPRKLWDDLEETNFLLGRPARLGDVVEPVDLIDPAYLPFSRSSKLAYNLVQVPDDAAAELDCAGINAPGLPARKYGTYFGSAFRIKAPEGRGAVLLLIWEKEKGFWKIVNMQIDSVNGKDDPVPDETAAALTLPEPESPGDSAMIGQMQDFFDALFLKKDNDKAFSFFAPSTYSCRGLATGGSTNSADTLRQELKQIASRSRVSNNLGHIIEHYDPENPTLKIFQHPHDSAYLLAAVPAREASNFLCQRPPQPGSTPGAKVTVPGLYVGTFFKLVEPGDEPAGLGLLWTKTNGVWKIVAYRMDEP